MANAVEIAGLGKSFGRTRALDGLTMTVVEGEVHGFLGPNGAGKTTALRILMGLLRADRGSVRVLGSDPWADAVALHRRIAAVPGDVALWPSLSGGETIDMLGRLRGGLHPGRRAELVERFALDTTKKARSYSKGNRQKVALIAALASDAELLLLDEPTAGLDPLMEAVFQECMREARSEGRTVLLSSHILAQVEALADRVSIIRKGIIVESGSLADLRHLTRTTIVARTRKSPEELANAQGVREFDAREGEVRFEVDSEHVEAVVNRLAALGVRSLVAHPPTLEQILLRHYDDVLHATETPDA
ncbi:ABC transporter ATP-binding protein [Hoyosella subflava]|uniref:Putative ABC transporter ATP-binding subunit n=1 Tax=Hoyosella subflava (strain DSM 45089 / JCM 17490 / NBRC 109087 / DQS3-9A1) TaxID=443218 RepID=F6EHL9_HOYSD|nr:ABC transporter ATP-binding protein [Hoyosella subflava]AEF42383.1 Putative ABC transporter ATP-binding subunit [Hoyosella subflava DQS3-9A1]